MSYIIEQNDSDIFFISYDIWKLHFFFTIKDRSAMYLVKNVPVYEDYNSSYEELLQKAKVPSLQIRRMRTMALET
jgi:hypothetical protein